MQPFSAPLRDHPQAKQLLENQAAIRQMLANPETQKLLRSLQKKNAGQLKSAAQSALQGDTAALTQVLNELAADPQAKQAMEQLQALASQLGLDGAAPSEDGEEAPGQAPSPPPFDLEEIGQMGRLLELFQTSQQTDPQADALIAALRPYLRPERQRKLDQAVRLAGLSRAARQAYRLWKAGELHL